MIDGALPSLGVTIDSPADFVPVGPPVTNQALPLGRLYAQIFKELVARWWRLTIVFALVRHERIDYVTRCAITLSIPLTWFDL